MKRERERRVQNVTEAKKLWRPQKHEKAKEIQTKVQQLLRTTLLQHFLCVLRPQTPTLPFPLSCPALPYCQPRLSKVEPFKDSALSFIRQTYDYTYVHMLVISGRETKAQIPVTKKKGKHSVLLCFFYCWN